MNISPCAKTFITLLISLPMPINFGLPLKVYLLHIANLLSMLIPLVTVTIWTTSLFLGLLNLNIVIVNLTLIILPFGFFPVLFLKILPVTISMQMISNKKWHPSNLASLNLPLLTLKHNVPFLVGYLWRISNALFNIVPNKCKCLILCTFRNNLSHPILAPIFSSVVVKLMQPISSIPILLSLMGVKLGPISLLVWFCALRMILRLQMAVLNASLALFKIVFVCAVLLRISLLMILPLIAVSRSPSTSKIRESAFSNVKVNINIRTMLRIVIS